jgi:hypothetical protein
LLVLALIAAQPAMAPTRLPVILLGVFLPGYQPGRRRLPASSGDSPPADLVGPACTDQRARCWAPDSAVDLQRATRSSGGGVAPARPSLGLAVGVIAALSLIGATNWLVLRGTAHESVHARLIAHGLPGYDVTPAGSLAGACGLFAIVFVLCLGFAALYNGLAALRGRGAASSSSSR